MSVNPDPTLERLITQKGVFERIINQIQNRKNVETLLSVQQMILVTQRNVAHQGIVSAGDDLDTAMKE